MLNNKSLIKKQHSIYKILLLHDFTLPFAKPSKKPPEKAKQTSKWKNTTNKFKPILGNNIKILFFATSSFTPFLSISKQGILGLRVSSDQQEYTDLT